MDTELFMECEEEELEPWQMVDDSVDEEDDFLDDYGETVDDSPSFLPASETPPATPAAAASPPIQIVSTTSVAPSPPPPPPPVPSIISSSVAPPPPPSVTTTTTTSSTSAPPLVAQGTPLILTQTPSGTFLLPAAPGTGNTQSILLTTQGFPVQTVVNRATPLVLNLQPGQTVQPLTLIQSSSLGQLIRPSIGVSPVLPQNQTRPGSFLQLPTTLTIRAGTPRPVNLQVTQVSGSNALKLATSAALPPGSANGVRPGLVGSSGTERRRFYLKPRRTGQ